MAKFYYGSINLTKLIDEARKMHSGFMRAGEKKQVYANVTLWHNDTPDKFGNTMSLQVNPAKDDTKFEKFYIGNLKEGESRTEQITASDLNDIPFEDDLPF